MKRIIAKIKQDTGYYVCMMIIWAGAAHCVVETAKQIFKK